MADAKKCDISGELYEEEFREFEVFKNGKKIDIGPKIYDKIYRIFGSKKSKLPEEESIVDLAPPLELISEKQFNIKEAKNFIKERTLGIRKAKVKCSYYEATQLAMLEYSQYIGMPIKELKNRLMLRDQKI